MCRTAAIRSVVSSRAFIRSANLSGLIEQLKAELRFIWLEDIHAGIGMREKFRARIDSWSPRRLPGMRTDPQRPALVLFTAGSEGDPKGVVLSHRNILANCAQLSSVIDIQAADTVFNAMPMFQAAGLTGGTILPLVSGVRTFHYPNPMHNRIIPGLIYNTGATICFSTDTILNNWARNAHSHDFHAMRYVFAGGEKVREETRRLFAERFGLRVLEFYGTTETSPAIAVKTPMHYRANTAGRLLPGIEPGMELVPGIDGVGRLLVRGPNVMLGCLYANDPGVLHPPERGWHDTGDIVSISASGFVSVLGRAARFARIGGETISLTAAESLASALWPDDQHAVVNLPDPRQGERLVLATTRDGADINALLTFARRRNVAENVIPRGLLTLAALPLLANGKVDYPAVERIAREADQAVAA
jgi:acyl-[acyl-carrier-protein]-phospholipid O-acyltransferase/long-chain-fatty-acid--[acyl-carrier-protein] ligase